MWRPRFKTRRTKHPCQDHHWQDVLFPTSWELLRLVPHKRNPLRQVSASHDKSPPRTTSLRLERQVSASNDKSPPRTTSCSFARAVSASDQGTSRTTWCNSGTWTLLPRRLGGADFPCHASKPAGGPRGQLVPTQVLMRLCSAAQSSNHRHIWPYSTQTPPEAHKYPLWRAQVYD
jgi:hypothetical protein